MTSVVTSQARQKKQPPKKEEWAPRMWDGCTFFAWMRMLVHNRFAVNWRYWYIAIIITVLSAFHSILRLIQQLVYGRRIAATEIAEQPIFIIGHWRTGTTYLHELLVLDKRHTFPNTYECFEPNHFLLTEWVMTHWMSFLMPTRRPMDNVQAGWDRPQEDEFALCMLGQPSPYLTIAFPNRPPQFPEYLDLEGMPPRTLASWKQVFVGYLKTLTYKKRKRLILKSPPHTCRIRVLLELFPEARFIHIMRDPYVVFPSTLNLWKSLYRSQGMQRPNFAGLEEHILSTFSRLYDKLEEGRKLVLPSKFFEMKYEDLVRDPVGQMESLYRHLGLGNFEEYRERLEGYLAENSGYMTNRYDLSPEVRDKITSRWGKVIRQYGYREGS
jgi:hypothetical protein